MKKILPFIAIAFLCGNCTSVQQVLNNLPTSGNLTTQQIAEGLKQALTVGTQNGTSKLSAVDGFFADAAVKILMPPEAEKVESTLRSVGLGSVVDKAILSMNRAAEQAATSAKPIFVNAIQSMTINDALGILQGGNFAATNYFKSKTNSALNNSFEPVIKNALQKTDATKYWADVFSVYNRFSKQKINTDLSAYVTQKAIDGIFYEVGIQEQLIRKDPAARVTDLLKKVFGSSLAQAGNKG